jgi:hypothetical protein
VGEELAHACPGRALIQGLLAVVAVVVAAIGIEGRALACLCIQVCVTC